MSDVLAVTQPYGVGYGSQFPFFANDPGAGNNFTRSFDGNFVRRVLSLVFTVTLANAGSNRLVTVEARGKDANAFWVGEVAAVQVINTAQRYVGDVWRGSSDFNTGTDACFGIAPILLYPGDTLNILIASINGSDAITAIRGVEERFSYDPRRLPEKMAG